MEMTNSTISTENMTSAGAYERPGTDYSKVAAYFVIIVLSLLGNTLVIAVVYRNANQRMRTPNNYFVVSMAVGDGLITVVNMVSQVVRLFHGYHVPLHGVPATIYCKIQHFTWMFLVAWSTGSLAAIAVDRFLLVFIPLKRIITLKRARIIIGAIIMLGGAVTSPYLFLSTAFTYKDFTYCSLNTVDFSWYYIYILLLFSLFTFFPFAIVLALYSAIAFKLCFRKSPGNPENQSRMNRRIFLLLITIVLLFLLCWMPIASVYFGCIVAPNEDNFTCHLLNNAETTFWLWFLAYSNSAINPYVYFIFCENFRHGAKSLCAAICRCGDSCARSNHVNATLELRPGILPDNQSN